MPLRKTASARVILALAVAALLAISGCGGDSGAETTSAAEPSTTAKAQAAKGSPAEGPGSSTKKAPSAGKANGPSATADSNPKQGSGGKQGPPIAVPKGPREPEPTPQQRAQATVASITLQSPATRPGPESTAILSTAHTCDGKDTSPPLIWSGVPAGTAELVLFAMNLVPIGEELFFDWAVAGLNPSLEGLEEGRLPKGALTGRNGFGKAGYSLCPPGAGETYIFALYALPQPSGAKQGFDPKALRKEVLASSGNVGLMAVSYER